MANKNKLERAVEIGITAMGLVALTIVLFATSADFDPLIEWLVS